jgi:tetratricopeptide (TPR) repeat protein
MRGHLREGRVRFDAILAMPGAQEHPAERALALEAAAGIAYWQGDMEMALKQYDECLALARAGGDRRALANALYNASFPRAVNYGDLKGAQPLIEESLSIYRELNDAPGTAQTLWVLGNLYNFLGRNTEAVAPLDESIERFRALGQRFGLGWVLHTRTLVAIKLSEIAVADAMSREGLAIFAEAGDVSGIVLLLADAAEVAHAQGDEIRAMTLAGAADAHGRRIGSQLNSIVTAEEGRNWFRREKTEQEQRAWDEGGTFSTDQGVAFALERKVELKDVSA